MNGLKRMISNTVINTDGDYTTFLTENCPKCGHSTLKYAWDRYTSAISVDAEEIRPILCTHCNSRFTLSEVFKRNNMHTGSTDIFGKEDDKDYVNHPNHYTNSKVECIDALESMTENYTNVVDAELSWQIVKYIWRHPFKFKPLEDLKKARWYLDRLIKKIEDGEITYTSVDKVDR